MQSNLHIFTCTATRDGHRWLVRCEEHPQAESKVRLLSHAVEQQRRALAAVTGVPETEIRVIVCPVLPAVVVEHLARVRELRQDAAEANHAAAAEYRAAARVLSDEGLTLRDIGTILGVSFQRAHQLVSRGGER